jgi:hypothetical protein
VTHSRLYSTQQAQLCQLDDALSSSTSSEVTQEKDWRLPCTYGTATGSAIRKKPPSQAQWRNSVSDGGKSLIPAANTSTKHRHAASATSYAHPAVSEIKKTNRLHHVSGDCTPVSMNRAVVRPRQRLCWPTPSIRVLRTVGDAIRNFRSRFSRQLRKGVRLGRGTRYLATNSSAISVFRTAVSDVRRLYLDSEARRPRVDREPH